jgi:hypothetical protein
MLYVNALIVKLLVNSGEVISMTHVLQVLFLSVFILQVVIHGEESQVPGNIDMMQKIPNTGFCIIISINRVMTAV